MTETPAVTRLIPVTRAFLAALTLYLEPDERYIFRTDDKEVGLALWAEDRKRLVFVESEGE